LIDVGSKKDICKHYESAVIHRAISDNRNEISCTAVVVREVDSLPTNVPGLTKLFRAYVGDNIIFCCYKRASGFIQLPLPAFFDTAVISGNVVVDEPCSMFVQCMLQVAEEERKWPYSFAW